YYAFEHARDRHSCLLQKKRHHQNTLRERSCRLYPGDPAADPICRSPESKCPHLASQLPGRSMAQRRQPENRPQTAISLSRGRQHCACRPESFGHQKPAAANNGLQTLHGRPIHSTPRLGHSTHSLSQRSRKAQLSGKNSLAGLSKDRQRFLRHQTEHRKDNSVTTRKMNTMPAIKHYLINGVTYWRIVMAPLIVALAIFGQEQLFKWLLLISFLTDAVDGKLARHYHIASKRGAMLDSLGDDLTVLAGFSGLLAFHLVFVLAHIVSLSFLAITCLLQFAVAIRKYGKPTAFHTILAKIAAVLQGLFLLTFFFWPGIPLILFYTAVGVTCLQLLEETIMVTLIPEWKSDV